MAAVDHIGKQGRPIALILFIIYTFMIHVFYNFGLTEPISDIIFAFWIPFKGQNVTLYYKSLQVYIFNKIKNR